MKKENPSNTYHIPVMPNETVGALNVQKDKLYFDGTAGGGGHSEQILQLGGRLIATDRDAEAVRHTQNRFSKNPEFAGRYTVIHDNFKNADAILNQLKIAYIDGALLDLGVSSRQLDACARGFSYMADAPLDMRMNQQSGKTAKDIVNGYSEEELARVLYRYGEEKLSRRIARAIVTQRNSAPIESTARLAQLVAACYPPFHKGGNPAKRTFQALRIEVNDELSGLDTALNVLFNRLSPQSRLAVISFHSLEDRVVKQKFKQLAADCICDKSLPVCVCANKAKGRLIGSKGIRPSPNELSQNPRSKSATLRVIEKI
ncbi:MAG: 16S rRNA (cytosine(1402)-N(4))-methyltransferase RsmH [Firmicutes bacterium]|nr:16S rRNA (cytosine(1402)-N(4))-methyltransferase RsmH [Bacillota bacterium]